MKLNTLLPLLMIATLTGCQSRAPQTPEETGEMPYGQWDFAFFTPHALPALVTRAMIIDSEKVVYTYRVLDSTPAAPGTVNTWNNRVRLNAQFNKARHPPALMLFCWDSIIDKKTYETRIVFPASLKEKMLTSTGTDRRGKPAWYDTILFGLAPEGKVRIWLQNSAGAENLPLEPKKITTLSGDKLDACKKITKHPDGYVYYGDTPEFIKGKTYPYGNW